MQTSSFDEEHTKWIASALRSIESIQVGTTHSELMKVFTAEEGWSLRMPRTREDLTSTESVLTLAEYRVFVGQRPAVRARACPC